MDANLISEIKKKKEFSKLPDSIVQKVASETGDVKEARALLRKYFGVFLTNKVIKGKGTAEEILKAHKSSAKRNYDKFYQKIFEEYGFDFEGVFDFGAGVNGYSYNFLREVIGDANYFAIEASGQVVENMNSYFDENHFSGRAICGDLFDEKLLDKLFSKVKGKKAIFLFQVIDALEKLERNYSKVFLTNLSKRLSSKDLVVISLPIESLSGKTNFKVRRKWLFDFLEEIFEIEKDFLMNGERMVCIRKK